MKFPWTKKPPEPPPPLVSVITPTWLRHEWVMECAKSVITQAYPRIQHVIVSDGPDYNLASLLGDYLAPYSRPGYELVVACLRKHDYSTRDLDARLYALKLSTGSLIAYIDDDQQYYADHLGSLYRALEAHPEAGFAYSSVHCIRYPGDGGIIIGEPTPRYQQIDTGALMHWKNLLLTATWDYMPGPEQHPDWDLVERWMQAGIKWTWTGRDTCQNYPTYFRECGWNAGMQYREIDWRAAIMGGYENSGPLCDA